MIVSQIYLFLDKMASELRKDYEMLSRFLCGLIAQVYIIEYKIIYVLCFVVKL